MCHVLRISTLHRVKQVISLLTASTHPATATAALVTHRPSVESLDALVDRGRLQQLHRLRVLRGKRPRRENGAGVEYGGRKGEQGERGEVRMKEDFLWICCNRISEVNMTINGQSGILSCRDSLGLAHLAPHATPQIEKGRIRRFQVPKDGVFRVSWPNVSTSESISSHLGKRPVFDWTKTLFEHKGRHGTP